MALDEIGRQRVFGLGIGRKSRGGRRSKEKDFSPQRKNTNPILKENMIHGRCQPFSRGKGQKRLNHIGRFTWSKQNQGASFHYSGDETAKEI